MLLSRVCVALAIAAITGAVPAPIKHVLHEKRERHSYDWVKGARVESSAVLPVRIGLTQNNLEKGDEYLMEVYVIKCIVFSYVLIYSFLAQTRNLPGTDSTGLLKRCMLCSLLLQRL